MECWRKCGEGFTGSEGKAAHRISGKHKRGGSKADVYEDVIDSKYTPEKKRAAYSNRDGYLAELKSLKKPAESSSKPSWAPKSLLSSFIETATPRQQDEDIEIATSSSDDSDPRDRVEASLKKPSKTCKTKLLENKKYCNKSHPQLLSSSRSARTKYSQTSCDHKTTEQSLCSNRSFSGPDPMEEIRLEMSTKPPCSKAFHQWAVSSFQCLTQTEQNIIHPKTSAKYSSAVSKIGYGRKGKTADCVRKDSHGCISDFESDSGSDQHIDSDTEDESENKRLTLKQSQEAMVSQGDISSGSSISSCQPEHRDTIKASEWVSVLQKQRTPVKKDFDVHTAHVEDSGKKKKKYDSGSLSDRVTRLQRRLKSSVRFWLHLAKEGTSQDKEDQGLAVRVLAISSLCSLSLLKCRIMSSSHHSVEHCKVYLHRDLADSLAVKQGTALTVYPTWQQLVTGSGELTVLCTNFVQVRPEEEGVVDAAATGLASPTSSVQSSAKELGSAVWACPCSSDPKLPSPLCPATKYPQMYKLPAELSERGVNHPHRLDQQEAPTTVLSSIHSHKYVNPESYLLTRDQLHASGQTLLDSKAMLKCPSDTLPPFCATVLRVFWQKPIGERVLVKYQLLIKDSAGTVALVAMPPVHLKKSKDLPVKFLPLNVASTFAGGCGDNDGADGTADKTAEVPWQLGNIEGKTCSFLGFTVNSRVTHDHQPELFSVLGSCWKQCGQPQAMTSGCPQQADASQGDSGEDYISQALSETSAVPSFAYVLQADPRNEKARVEEMEKCSEGYNAMGTGSGLGLMTVNQALKSSDGDRVTFAAKIAHCCDQEECGTSRSKVTLLVFDGDLSSSDFTLVHRLALAEEHLPSDFCASLCFFRDVLIVNGSLQCDSYTLILPQAHWSSWGFKNKLSDSDWSVVGSLAAVSLRVPRMTNCVRSGQVVSLEGHISSVDEDSACMLDQCCVCGADLLVHESGLMHCNVCEEDTTHSVQVIRMSAFLTSSDMSPNTVFRVEFSQKTIKSILPSEADEEGYDIDHVINQRVSCDACIVESISTAANGCGNLIYLKELDYT